MRGRYERRPSARSAAASAHSSMPLHDALAMVAHGITPQFQRLPMALRAHSAPLPAR